MIFSSNTKGAAVTHAGVVRNVDGECKVLELVRKDDKYEEKEVDKNEECGEREREKRREEKGGRGGMEEGGVDIDRMGRRKSGKKGEVEK